MEDKEDKINCLDILVHIDELMSQIRVLKNSKIITKCQLNWKSCYQKLKA